MARASGQWRHNAEANFHGKKRSNKTQCLDEGFRCTALPQRIGQEGKLCFIDHGFMEKSVAFWLIPV
jgi:hypothetical protein